MRRNRRNRSTWFPILATEGEGTNPVLQTFDYRIFPVHETGAHEVVAIPLIPDETWNVDSTVAGSQTLRDFVEGQTCIIDRVVGSVYWSLNFVPGGGENVQPKGAFCCSALAVLPVYDANPNVPSLLPSDYDPLNPDNAEQPWLWRRTWALTADDTVYNFPRANSGYGSLREGTALDTKGTKRAIRREQRIFMIHSNVGIGMDGVLQPNAGFVMFDVRVIGNLRRGKNRSTFK